MSRNDPSDPLGYVGTKVDSARDRSYANHAQSSVTATADGTGTGVVPDGTDFATVTSANANHIVTLPYPTPGTVVAFRNGATGYELRSSAPASVAINGGTGAAAESAIPATTRTVCHCDTATTWLCHDTDTAGVVSASEVAAP